MPASTLSSSREEDNASNRKAMVKMLPNIRLLGRRNIPLRGDGDGNNCNFTQIFHLRTEDNPAWQMQNEMLKVVALEVLKYVADSHQSSPLYSKLAGETTDSFNRDQVVICFRWVDNRLNAHKEFIGVQQVDRIDAAKITFHNIKDILHRMNLR